MNPIMTLDGQSDLPRYFAATFAMAQKLNRGRIDFRLIPSFLPDKLSASGAMVVADAPGSCSIVITGDISS